MEGAGGWYRGSPVPSVAAAAAGVTRRVPPTPRNLRRVFSPAETFATTTAAARGGSGGGAAGRDRRGLPAVAAAQKCGIPTRLLILR